MLVPLVEHHLERLLGEEIKPHKESPTSLVNSRTATPERSGTAAERRHYRPYYREPAALTGYQQALLFHARRDFLVLDYMHVGGVENVLPFQKLAEDRVGKDAWALQKLDSTHLEESTKRHSPPRPLDRAGQI